MNHPRYLDRGREIEVAAGANVYGEGGGPHVAYVVNGRIEYSFILPGDSSVAFCETCGPGCLLGLVDTYASGPDGRLTGAVALEDSTLYVWDRKGFDRAIGIYQELARLVIQSLSRRLRAVNELARQLDFQP